MEYFNRITFRYKWYLIKGKPLLHNFARLLLTSGKTHRLY